MLFSGGQDSTICLAWALARFARVETVGFDYGQRHAVELDARPRILARCGGLSRIGPRGLARIICCRWILLKAIGGGALTDDMAIAMGADGLPTTFVPGRNLLFLTSAAALAYRRGIADLVGGMCETDFSGYPDCRDETIQATAQGAVSGPGARRSHPDAADVDRQGGDLGAGQGAGRQALVDLIVEDTVTCYQGDRAHRHDWGYGCGVCPACELRAAWLREGQAPHELRVKEIFSTLQGEGAQAGRPAVFCRFAGCNLWSGREEDRAEAVCKFCDTDFVGTDGPGGGKFADAAAWPRPWRRNGRRAPRQALCRLHRRRTLLQLDGR